MGNGEPCHVLVICEVVHVHVFSRYVIVYEKGYQDTDVPETLALTKVKGVSYTEREEPSGNYTRVWDVADYVVPPEVRL